MNVLSALLNKAGNYGVFDYHPKCKKIELTHLCFADDLLVFAKGNVESILGIKSVLDLFYCISGLHMNSAKSELFSTGIGHGELQRIVVGTGIHIGKLPIRYLGVPLTTKNLSAADCKALTDRITNRIRHWSTKSLSFAGRLQLLQSVIFSLNNFWCRIFVLPGKVIKSVSQLCNAFLWKGVEGSARGAKVSWDDICHPKSEGGLGIKDLDSWNKACILQNLWAVWMQSGSLWVAWVQAYILKEVHVEDYQVRPCDSWAWKKLMRLRSLLTQTGPFQTTFKPRLAWEVLRPRKPKVPWHRFIWGCPLIPRHAFISWLAILDRLVTKNKLIAWGYLVEPLCSLCSTEPEDCTHLFFGCSFSSQLWALLLQKLGDGPVFHSWPDALGWLLHVGKGKSLRSALVRLVWNAFIYHVWQERNHREHGAQSRTVYDLFHIIVNTVKIRIFHTSNIARGSLPLCLEWGFV